MEAGVVPVAAAPVGQPPAGHLWNGAFGMTPSCIGSPKVDIYESTVSDREGCLSQPNWPNFNSTEE
jgi:hypothetical protein